MKKAVWFVLLIVVAILALSACAGIVTNPPLPSETEYKSLDVANGEIFWFKTNTTQGEWVQLTVKSTNPPIFSGRTFNVHGGNGRWTVYESGSKAIAFFVKTSGDKISVYDTHEGAAFFTK